jgi:hypothetical protein
MREPAVTPTHTAAPPESAANIEHFA